MDMDTYAELFHRRVVGAMALAMIHRGTQPGILEMELLEKEDLTLNDVAQLMYVCGVSLGFEIRTVNQEDGE